MTQHRQAARSWQSTIPGPQLVFEQVGQFDRSFDVLRVAAPSGRCERQEHPQSEKSPRPLN